MAAPFKEHENAIFGALLVAPPVGRGAAATVLDLVAVSFEQRAQLVRAWEVFRSPRRCTLVDQLLNLRRKLGGLRRDAGRLQFKSQNPVEEFHGTPDFPVAAPICLGYQLARGGQRPRRVEVVV